MTAGPAHAGCSLSFSGVNEERSCSYTTLLPNTKAVAYVRFNGHAYLKVVCNTLQVVNSGLMSGDGSFRREFVNPGGQCALIVGVNGTIYNAYAT